MFLLTDSFGIGLLDGCACALLAAAASCRARSQGAHFTGAAVLGCLCGIMGPLLREAFLHGQPGTGVIASQMPGDALLGALAGIVALYLASRYGSKIFFWLDAASIGLASSIGAVLALQELGIVGAICLGLINGLAPGLVRDMALGDVAMLVDSDWYATAAALGCVIAIATEIWCSIGTLTTWMAEHADELAALTGFALVLLVRFWRSRRQIAP